MPLNTVRVRQLKSHLHTLSPHILQRREFIRPIAKSTLWGKRNFGSWLVENTGSVPVKRRRDFNDGPVDNSESMAKIIEV